MLYGFLYALGVANQATVLAFAPQPAVRWTTTTTTSLSRRHFQDCGVVSSRSTANAVFRTTFQQPQGGNEQCSSPFVSVSTLQALPPATTAYDVVTQLAQSVFRAQGGVPLVEALGINVVLFASLQAKLFTMLTPAGFAHALGLGTMLWTTLGWKGWLYCVLYLFLGQLVTKIRFAEKEVSGACSNGRR